MIELKIRADIYAWYTVLGSLGAAFGAVSCGWVVQYLQDEYGWLPLSAYRLIFLIYSVIAVLKFGMVMLLTPDCELQSISQVPDVQTVEPDVASGSNGESYPMTRMGKATESSASLDGIEADDTRDIFDEMDQLTERQKRPIYLRWLNYMPHLTRQSLLIVAQLILWFSLDSFGSGLASQ